ncbi:MAG TPA: ScyD/ScyE family protein [Marmoricola sp.]|nr:ScyD/ScyE family protein [Marmoricola sp.]
MASLIALGTAAALVATPSATASTGDGARVITTGLDGPFGLQKAVKHRGLIVAESESGEVTRVFMSGRKHTLLGGMPGVAGVAASPKRVFAVIGGPNEEGAPSGGSYGPSKVVRMDYHGKHVKVIADLMKYELKNNPDGQVQFVNGQPVDSISNPFAMTWSRFGLFVADGGANDVLRVNPRTGRVHTFFVPKTVKLPGCENANPGATGCDPVPTGVQVLGNSLYVSTLGAEFPGAGRIYKLNARTGKVQRVWKHLTAPTGVAARRDGTVYFSQVLYGAPEGPPPPGFGPSDIGRIGRIHNGHRTYADVTMPTGLVLKNGHLFASTWSVASFFGLSHAGRVTKVPESKFK